MANTRNLKPWPKGVSGNPGGRPRGLIGKALLTQLLKADGRDLQAIVTGIIGSAAKGNPAAFAIIRDSVDGKPAQQLDVNASAYADLAERLERARKRPNTKLANFTVPSSVP
jgi:hypothetical protein